MNQAALLGGLFIGVLSALPIVSIANCCCLWIVSGGALAAYLEQQNQPAGITPGRGAWVGLLAGVIGAVVWLVAAAALDVLVAPLQERAFEEMLRSARDMPPEARAWLEVMADRSSPTARYAAGFVFQLVAGAAAAALGGVLGAAFFARKGRPASGDQDVPPR